MHVDSVATNAARRVIQPLDDVASALKLTEADFAPVPWQAGIYQDKRYAIPLDVHPLGFFYNKTVMEKAGSGPGEAADRRRGVSASALDTLKSKGIQGDWATPFPFTGSMTVQSLLWQYGGELFAPDASTRHLGRRARRQGDDLVRRPGQERLLAGQDRPGRRHRSPCRTGRPRSTGTASGASTPCRGEQQEPRVGRGGAAQHRRQAGRLGRFAPVRAPDPEDRRTRTRAMPPGSSSTGSASSRWSGPRPVRCRPATRCASRRSSRRSRTRPPSAPRSTTCTSRLPVPGHRRRHAGVGEGPQRVRARHQGSRRPRSSDAAGRANQILEANKKKYGG